ncbi:AraC family transcriptional regulator [Caulobacter flavus]|uniref:AraC family transcriptional regulator n=1 Tax=Caulobacter flavus TaxID=1679497 RepID=A0A2N5CKH6_9CAUL|nr:AraC family transcriptional regulator [Caulobacter flavus]AYV47655.1 AraC family transcriptional regulator [Caulobacter flavus]PLR05847.1 AraC family transcriptional regulator [Caulobacter flavus]
MSFEPMTSVAAASGFDRVIDLRAGALPDLIAGLLADARAAAREDRLVAERRVREAIELVQREGKRLLDDARPAPVTGGLAPWQVRKVDAHLAANIDAPVKVSDLAALVRLSVSHFSRAFAVSYGGGAREHIIQRRLERARQMMIETDEPLGQIAAACGFADQAHFSNRFRRAFETSPLVWRRLHQRGQVASIDAADSAFA